MTTVDFLDALTAPLRSATTFVVMLTFYGLLTLADAAGPFGLWLAVAVIPALFRYLVMLADARARGVDAPPPAIEYFSLAGNIWTLFPVLPALLFSQAYTLIASSGEIWGIVFALLAVFVFPAMMGVLILTHSPLEALNPVALTRFVRACRPSYPFAVTVALTLIALPYILAAMPARVTALLALTLTFSLYCVIGELIRRHRLLDEVDIPAPREPDDVNDVRLERQRVAALNHAYGFASRGNLTGALAHIEDGLRRDPDPLAARGWYFERMLDWDDPLHALTFGQHYLHELLAAGDQLRAVKLLLRGRLIDDRFRPLPEDVGAAVAAARACRNDELAEQLGRR